MDTKIFENYDFKKCQLTDQVILNIFFKELKFLFIHNLGRKCTF